MLGHAIDPVDDRRRPEQDGESNFDEMPNVEAAWPLIRRSNSAPASVMLSPSMPTLLRSLNWMSM